MSIDYTQPVGQVRLLLADVDEDRLVFTDEQLGAFLSMEDENVKLAAAQAIEVNATDQVLASKVLRTQDLSTDGAKVAAAMRVHAAVLREQAAAAVVEADEGYFEIVEQPNPYCWPELTERPTF